MIQNEESCVHCSCRYDKADMFETGKGDYCCDDCATEQCCQCFDGEPSIEVRNEGVCIDCYSGMIDDAYEASRE